MTMMVTMMKMVVDNKYDYQKTLLMMLMVVMRRTMMVTMTMSLSFSITGNGDEGDGYEDEDDDDDDGGGDGDGALPQQPFLITSAPSASKLPISIHPVMATMILMIFKLVDNLLMTNITLHRFVTLNGSLLG